MLNKLINNTIHECMKEVYIYCYLLIHYVHILYTKGQSVNIFVIEIRWNNCGVVARTSHEQDVSTQ